MGSIDPLDPVAPRPLVTDEWTDRRSYNDARLKNDSHMNFRILDL